MNEMTDGEIHPSHNYGDNLYCAKCGVIRISEFSKVKCPDNLGRVTLTTPIEMRCVKHGNIGADAMNIRAFSGDTVDSYCLRCYKEMLEPIKALARR